ncbi:MAG: agmatinase [Anaerolineales bacterium]|nr:agmatinase [Anaerolineales bacterium]
MVLDLLEKSLPFAGIASFMNLPYTRNLQGADLVIAGVPFDGGTFYRPGARFGPRAIREQSVYASEFQPVYPWDYSLTERFTLIDFGDIAPLPASGGMELMLELTEAVAQDVFKAGAGLLTLGGDHTIPYGPIRAAAKHHGKLALIHLDAHQDSIGSDQIAPGSRFINHGTFASDLVTEGCIDPVHSSQVYIRTHMPPVPGDGYQIFYANEALQFLPEVLAETIKARVGNMPVYLTLDIDALDPSFAPGTGTPVPGGPTSADVRRFLKALDGLNIVAADIVEVSPVYDPSQTTAITAAFLAIDLLYLLGSAYKNRS